MQAMKYDEPQCGKIQFSCVCWSERVRDINPILIEFYLGIFTIIHYGCLLIGRRGTG